jgi:catechol 2,3-dioxygenase
MTAPVPVIGAVGHVALRVSDLDAAVEHATNIMGLRVSERSSERVDLTHGAPHHSLQYIRSDSDAVDHLALEASSPDALEEIRTRLRHADIPLLSEVPLDEQLAEGFVFEGPDGFVFEIYRGMPQDQPSYRGSGVRPRRFGHVNISVPDPVPLLSLLQNVLDFRISDNFRGGAFLRCNAEHHGVAVLRGRGILHHHAWEVESIADLGHLGDLVDEGGDELVAGPVRHGMGNNIAAYIEGPGHVVVEYYTDMDKIFDEDGYVPGSWSEEGHKWYSRWAPELPGDRFRALGVGPARTSYAT